MVTNQTTIDRIDTENDAEADANQPQRSTTSFGSQVGYEADEDETAGWTVAKATEGVSHSRIFDRQ